MISDLERTELLFHDHEEIFEAFKGKDCKVVRERVEKHLRSVGRIVVKNLNIYSHGMVRQYPAMETSPANDEETPSTRSLPIEGGRVGEGSTV